MSIVEEDNLNNDLNETTSLFFWKLTFSMEIETKSKVKYF